MLCGGGESDFVDGVGRGDLRSYFDAIAEKALPSLYWASVKSYVIPMIAPLNALVVTSRTYKHGKRRMVSAFHKRTEIDRRKCMVLR